MTDLHTHILPGIDDGAKDAKESIAMILSAYEQGVNFIAATPHVMPHGEEEIGKFLIRREECFNALREEIAKRDEDFPRLTLGAEVFLDNDITQYKNFRSLCYVNTNVMLLELDPGKYSDKYSEWIYSIVKAGVKPVIAHVDRYPWRDELFEDTQFLGAVHQINASRFLTLSGRRTARGIIQHGGCCIVASDMHNLESRPCNMKQAYVKMEKYDEVEAEDVFSKNALGLMKEESVV
jgi:protein-tyrosine phosphatase